MFCTYGYMHTNINARMLAPMCIEQTKLAVCGQWRESEILLFSWGMWAYDKRKGLLERTQCCLNGFLLKADRQVRSETQLLVLDSKLLKHLMPSGNNTVYTTWCNNKKYCILCAQYTQCGVRYNWVGWDTALQVGSRKVAGTIRDEVFEIIHWFNTCTSGCTMGSLSL